MAHRPRRRIAKRSAPVRPQRRTRRESAAAEAPSPRRLHNLPTQLTSFIGREQQIAEIKRLLDATRLLTLTGPGGCGKTRLALQVAADLPDKYPDGVWLADLAALSDHTLVPKAVASALGTPEQAGRSLTDTLADSLHAKTLLLLLDNCEHLVGACAELADGLLRSCPHLRILATSREPLGVAAETLWQVPSLSIPDPKRSVPLEHLARYEAVRLFVERAGSRQPGFALTERNAAAVARICARLDGIPLAVELAATRIKGLTAEQIARRLDDGFRLLMGGTRARLPRHQTLNATMDWSYGMLTIQERGMLRRLAVFAGGFASEAAEAICAGGEVSSSDALDLLTRLVDKSLVMTADYDGETWYRLLETVREYATEQLTLAGEADMIRYRHRDWYISLAKQAAPRLHGPEQVRWLNRLEAEHDNLRVALDSCRGEQDAAELSAALRWFWYIRGHYAESRSRLEAILASNSTVSPATRAQVLAALVPLILFHGDFLLAAETAETGLTLSRDIGDRETTVSLLLNLASATLWQGNHERAVALGNEALELGRALDHKPSIARAITFLGLIAQVQDQTDDAARCFQECLAIAEATGDRRQIALSIGNLGFVAMDRGEYPQAAARYAEALRRTRELADPWMIAQLFWAIARIAFTQGQYQRAACLFGVAEASREAIGYQRSPYSRARYEDGVARTRAALGETGFEGHWSEGRAMMPAQAIEYAIATADLLASKRSAKGRDAARRAEGLLTSREREVAIFVAQGLSNRDIAGRLVISERTAETHIQNILNKLGADSRASIAAWAVRHGLSAFCPE